MNCDLRLIASLGGGSSMVRYGLNAAIIAGVFFLALGEPALVAGGRFSDYLPASSKITPPAGLYLEDDIYFHDGKTNVGVRLDAAGRRVASPAARTSINPPTTSRETLTCNFVSGLSPWRCRRVEVTLS
jgi:hypothetical protein